MQLSQCTAAGASRLRLDIRPSGQCQIQEGSVRNVKFSRCAARNKDVQGCPMGRNECVPPLKRVPGTHLVPQLVSSGVQNRVYM